MATTPKPAVLTAFGDRVRTLRTERDLSQEQFAFKCGIDRTYISGIERGRRNPSLISIERIAKTLKVPLSKLFENVK